VDKQGNAVYFKHGVRLIEAAEIRLEALSTTTTTVVFLLPYLCLALAVYISSSGLADVTRHWAPGTAQCTAGSCRYAHTVIYVISYECICILLYAVQCRCHCSSLLSVAGSCYRFLCKDANLRCSCAAVTTKYACKPSCSSPAATIAVLLCIMAVGS
jgi:hypothetical protein